MYESSGSHFFRSTTGIRSRPSTLDKSRLIVTFLTNLGYTWISCSFKLVLEGKPYKEIPEWVIKIEVLRKAFLNSFTLVESEENILGQVRTLGNSQKVMRANFLQSDRLFSISKFGSFKNPFATNTSPSEFYFICRRFISVGKNKKVISMSYGCSTSCWKGQQWMRLDMILTMRKHISQIKHISWLRELLPP